MFYDLTSSVEDSDEDYKIEDAAEMLGHLRSRGEITSARDVEILSDGQISLPIAFGEKAIGFQFTFSQAGDPDQMKITNYAPGESRGKSFTDLGADTVYTADLRGLSELRNLYLKESDKVRLIALLSPT